MLFPNDFEAMMRSRLGAAFDEFAAAADAPCPTSIRLNDKAALLPDSACRKVGHCDSGYFLPERPIFSLDPLWHCGAYYVQEASSMYLEQVFRHYVSGKVRILDLSAAPGGKSTHLANLMEKGSLLVSNEIMPARAAILLENMQRWGCPSTVLTNNSPGDFAFLNGFFDVLLCDMPCSGEGMFRKEPEALRQWSMQFVKSCARKQRQIISEIWDCLREDGLLIYSTCTFNPYENEENIEWIASTFGAEILESRHFYFHDTSGEGFFIAALRKSSSAPLFRMRNVKPKKTLNSPLSHYLRESEAYRNLLVAGNICAVPLEYADEIAMMVDNLRVISAGVPLCAADDPKQIPLPAFALFKAFDRAKCQIYNVRNDEALAYLKGECLQMPGLEKGKVAVCFGSLPLGWAANIGSRANNLYPKNWRIKINIQPCKSYFSEQERPQACHI